MDGSVPGKNAKQSQNWGSWGTSGDVRADGVHGTLYYCNHSNAVGLRVAAESAACRWFAHSPSASSEDSACRCHPEFTKLAWSKHYDGSCETKPTGRAGTPVLRRRWNPPPKADHTPGDHGIDLNVDKREERPLFYEHCDEASEMVGVRTTPFCGDCHYGCSDESA